MKIIVQEADLTYEGLTFFHIQIRDIVENTETNLTLDFQKITMTLDSLAIGELMKFHTLLKEKKLELRLSNVNKLTRTVFRLNKLDTILLFDED